MDYNHAAYQNAPAIQFEQIVIKNSLDLLQIDKIKKEASLSMNQLEGWCTKFKAHILIDLVLKTKATTVVEVGVWGGKSLIPMAYALKALGQGIVYGIDPWSSTASVEGMDKINADWWGSIDHEMIYQGLVQKIDQFDLADYVTLLKCTSTDAPIISNIDILHIDGNHSEETSLYDAMKWVPLVRSGGFIIFDDTTWGTTARAVEWLDTNCIRLADYHENNDWSLWIKP